MTPQGATQLRLREAEPTAPRAPLPDLAVPLPARPSGPLLDVVGVDFADAPAPRRHRRLRISLRGRLLGLADLTSLLVLAAAARVLDGPGLADAVLLGAPVVVLLFKLAGLYDRDELRLMPSTIDEAPSLLQLTGLFVLAISILRPVLLGGTVGPAPAAALWVASFVAIFTARGLARGAVRRVSPVERCLVIGELAQVERLRERLAASAAHARVIACLPLTGEGIDELDAPEIVRHLVADLRVQRIIVAPSRMDSVGVVGLIRIAKAAGLRISVLSRMVEGIGSGIEFDEVDGMTMLGVRQFGLSPSSMLLKRLFDLLATIGGMIVVGPLLSIIALMIKLDSHGPVFFRQTRVGRDGRHFRMIKFRSMVVGAEERKADLLALNEVGEGMFKVSDDPRVTRIGRMLRRTSLDELPQLLNVLRGEMSLVGPRPLVVAEDAQIVGLDRARLQLTPGMTGPWQVLGSRVSLQEMVGIDYRYVAGWSLWLDLKILLRTVRHVLRRGNV